jgi:putative FmdB family regulatory protein
VPTYEYRCPEGHEFEKFQRMSDPPEAECPECGQAAERILSGGAGLLFKGEGFYITDYRSDSYKKAAQKEKGSAKGGSGEASTSGGGKDAGGAKDGGAKGSTGSGGGTSGGGE